MDPQRFLAVGRFDVGPRCVGGDAQHFVRGRHPLFPHQSQVRVPQRQKDRWLTPDYEAALMGQQCLKRHILPDEIARFALFLASDEASACTGQHYVVDGGWV